ncbi:MAG: 2-oxoglutarate and iron-dependent oxygenase domain-containing protein [Alsobacter sp.]
MTLPVVDLSRFRDGDLDDKRAVARETDQICRDIGFLSVTGHNVPEPVTAELYARAKAFFHQNPAEKLKVRQPSRDLVRGYIGFAEGALAATRGDETPPDLKESYTMGPDEPGRGAPNIWPSGNTAFKAAWLAYFAEMDRLGREMMRLFAMALDLDAGHFENAFRRHSSILSAIYYPDQPEAPADGQLRAGAHTDFGTLTILRSDDAPGGLQVMTAAGEWLPARREPGSLIINIGDMLARWTNDRWVSTLHRVVNPPRDAVSGTERLSIGFFYQPDDDCVVECLPSCVFAGGQALYPPVTAGDYIASRFRSQIVASKEG